MSLQLYSKIACYYNGDQLSESNNVSVKQITGAQVIKTISKGFAGLSPGSPMTEITVKSNIPAAGFERSSIFDDALNLNVVELTLFLAGGKKTAKGFITEVNMSQGVDAASEIDITFQGEWAAS